MAKRAVTKEQRRSRSRTAQNLKRRAERGLASLKDDVVNGRISDRTYQELSNVLSRVVADNTYDRKLGSYGTSSEASAVLQANRAFQIYNAREALLERNLSGDLSEAIRERRSMLASKADFESALDGGLSTYDSDLAMAFLKDTSDIWRGYDKSHRLDVIVNHFGASDIGAAFEIWKKFQESYDEETGRDVNTFARAYKITSPKDKDSLDRRDSWNDYRKELYPTREEAKIAEVREKMGDLMERAKKKKARKRKGSRQ